MLSAACDGADVVGGGAVRVVVVVGRGTTVVVAGFGLGCCVVVGCGCVVVAADRGSLEGAGFTV